MKSNGSRQIRLIAWWLIGGVAVLGLSGCSGSASTNPDGTSSGTVERSPGPSAGGGSGSSGSSPPSVTLAAAESAVEAGGSVQLSWSSAGASECQASGGWAGAQTLQGSAVVGPLTTGTTFTLSCSGLGGNAMAMLSVGVTGVITLRWQPPTENVDGTPVTDLAGFRILYGERTRSYTRQLQVSSPSASQQDVVLASGTYYFVMTALDRQGNESAYSNEVVRVLR